MTSPPSPAPTTAWITTALHSADWVDATPFRAHLHYLVGASGLHGRVIAQHCGIPTRLADRLLVLGEPPTAGRAARGRDTRRMQAVPPTQPVRRARRITHYCAARLLAVRPGDLVALRWASIASGPVLTRLDQLVAEGYDLDTVAAAVDASATELELLRRHRWPSCPQVLALQVAAAGQVLLADQPQIEPGTETTPVRSTRAG